MATVISEQFLELLDRHPRIFDDPTHGKGIDRICARDNDDSLAIGHRDVFSLPDYPEPRLLKGSDSATMGYPREFGHVYTGTSTRRVIRSFNNSSTVVM